MEIYLVRHGQTGGNLAHRHQTEHTPLTKLGEQQAIEVARKIKELNPTHLVTSSLIRTIETARYISEACDLIPSIDINLVELKRPFHMYGQYHRSISSLCFYVWWYLGRDTVLRDRGESYRALRERIEIVKSNLSKYPDDARVIVVTHSVFIGMFLAHLCNSRPLTPLRALSAFRRILNMPNANVYKIKYDKDKDAKVCAWSLEN